MCVCVYVCSHGATLVLVCVRVFEAESLLGAIFLQVGELFTVDGSTALPRTAIETNNVGSRQCHCGKTFVFSVYIDWKKLLILSYAFD